MKLHILIIALAIAGCAAAGPIVFSETETAVAYCKAPREAANMETLAAKKFCAAKGLEARLQYVSPTECRRGEFMYSVGHVIQFECVHSFNREAPVSRLDPALK